MLEVKNMVKTFFKGTINEKTALQGIDLRLEEGDFCTVIGGNGAGKSTLLNSIAGVFPVDEGSITINDIDVTKMPEYKRAKYIGRVFQDPMVGTAGNMQIEENLILAMRRGKNLGLKWAFKDSEQAFFKERLALLGLGLEDRLSARMGLLSGGQRQRVAIARAIINEPRVVLLDEPLSALDLKLRTDMQYELRELQQRLGITFVFVTHDQEEALAMSDWIFVMNEGEIVQSGTPVDIYDEPINHFVATFIGESNILPGIMIEDYLVEFNGKRFESVDGGMRPNEPVEVVIRPEDLRITLPEEGKLQVKVDTQLFRGVHYEIIAYDELGNEWMIHSTRKAIVGEEIGLDFEPEDIHVMRLNETEEEFDARIEEYVEVEEQEAGLINAIEEERDEENNL